jgi:hypothetical protein
MPELVGTPVWSATMTMAFAFKSFEDLEQGDLIRYSLKGETRFAIVGRQMDGRWFCCALTGEGAPMLFNAGTGIGVTSDYDALVVLSYGNGFRLLPRHTKACDVGEGPLYRTKGALIVTPTESLIVVPDILRNPPNGLVYFSIEAGQVRTDLRGSKGSAAFGEWLVEIEHGNQTTTLISSDRRELT